MPLRWFTIGYQGRSLVELVSLLGGHDVAAVVDVRDVAWSRRPDFCKSRLRAALVAAGIHYEHARFAGNPRVLRRQGGTHADSLRRFDRYLTGKPEVIAELDALARAIVGGVALLCYERHPADCHRALLLKHWREATEDTRSRIVHIEPDGAQRFTDWTISRADPAIPLWAGTTGR